MDSKRLVGKFQCDFCATGDFKGWELTARNSCRLILDDRCYRILKTFLLSEGIEITELDKK
jgi:hypothetical protein